MARSIDTFSLVMRMAGATLRRCPVRGRVSRYAMPYSTKVTSLSRPERERCFWEIVDARTRNGVVVTQADANALAAEYEIESPNLSQAAEERAAIVKDQIRRCAEFAEQIRRDQSGRDEMVL